MDDAAEQINQDERILQIGLDKKSKSIGLIGFFLHKQKMRKAFPTIQL